LGPKQWRSLGECRGVLKPPYYLASMEAPQTPLQILWRKKKEGENFEEEKEAMRKGKKEEGKESP